MKTNIILFRITSILLFLLISLSVSCTKKPDIETMHLYILANEAYANGNFTETIKILQKANKFPPALILRAKAEYFSEDLDKAEKSCRRLLKLQPSSHEAKFYLARILYEKNNLPASIKITESLLTDNPWDIRTLRLAAELAGENGRHGEAAGFLDRAVELSAESAMVLLDRARMRWTAGRDTEALDDLNRAKAMLPWDTPLLRSIVNLENTIKEIM